MAGIALSSHGKWEFGVLWISLDKELEKGKDVLSCIVAVGGAFSFSIGEADIYRLVV